MRIEVLNTGTELLLGQTLNTHGSWLGKELAAFGLRTKRQTTVGDDEDSLMAMKEALDRADVLIVTGGLGPTSDDRNREYAAIALELELITDEAALRSLESYFAKRNRLMAEANLKQALVPVGADVLPNPYGTAPGIYVPPRLNPRSNCALFLLPGPPDEFYPMARAEVFPRVHALAGHPKPLSQSVMNFVGIGESLLHQRVDRALAEIPGLEVGYCAHIDGVELRLIGTDEALVTGKALAKSALADFLISDCGQSLAAHVVDLLAEGGRTVAFAESCTGGDLANQLTDVPGASGVLGFGWVTYSNAAKIQELGVAEESLSEFGAVSEVVVREMAEGARRAAGSDYALAVTGIAGPAGGSPDKPVGTVWIGLASATQTSAQKHFFPRGRREFKDCVVAAALDCLRREITGLSG